MTNTPAVQARSVLKHIAHRAMIERGLEPDFSPAALAEIQVLHAPAIKPSASIRDLRSLLWCSIDNDDSRDLDQLSVAESLPDGMVKLLVAIADVASLVPKGSALDAHARKNNDQLQLLRIGHGFSATHHCIDDEQSPHKNIGPYDIPSQNRR